MRTDLAGLPGVANGTVLTVGTFDGVHRGHIRLLERTAEVARRLEASSVVLTFDPHPLDVVNPSASPPLLTDWSEKLELFAQTSVDYVVVLPFTPQLSSLDAEAFVDRVLLARFHMRALVVGHDHGFGRGRGGDAESLRVMCRKRDVSAEIVGPVRGADDEPVSSTLIRRAIAHGDLARAADGLGRRYGFVGRVGAGEGRGRQLGFPTLNIELAARRKLLPPHGVYAVRATSRSGSYGGMMNLGPRPTFGDDRVSLEVHLFEASGDWYGQSLRVDFVARLRDTIQFAGPAELVAQLRRDADHARNALTASDPAATVKGSATNTSSAS
jgi:riboflavin kinase/FMN adenylyltransferase